ncbi:unnamed protein product [Bursaphelenchus xylophilus]|uniref:(pine wood nematode) hypothetical protein n=1 Tax=Bursaphelenchus xylophilus TaxID=6326 RepID=A0A7I8WXM7_BURXY|nr:unnamed protein product [Bursaphelenchus xylophilus]CAG9100358.1 unnamed protein product [Bursaphelenchus xylophilus]
MDTFISARMGSSLQTPQQTSRFPEMADILCQSLLPRTKANFTDGIAFCRVINENKTPTKPCDFQSPDDFYYVTQYKDKNGDSDVQDIYDYAGGSHRKTAVVFKHREVRRGIWCLYYLSGNPRVSKKDLKVIDTNYQYTQKAHGGLFVISFTGKHNSPDVTVFQSVPDNNVSIMWQVPQIIVMSIGEILIAVTGLEFSYQEAAPSMKSVVSSLFLLTNAIGDLLLIGITKISFSRNMAVYFFLFCGLMTVTMVVFTLLSIFYYEYKKDEESFVDEIDMEDEDDFTMTSLKDELTNSNKPRK